MASFALKLCYSPCPPAHPPPANLIFSPCALAFTQSPNWDFSMWPSNLPPGLNTLVSTASPPNLSIPPNLPHTPTKAPPNWAGVRVSLSSSSLEVPNLRRFSIMPQLPEASSGQARSRSRDLKNGDPSTPPLPPHPPPSQQHVAGIRCIIYNSSVSVAPRHPGKWKGTWARAE